MILILMIYKFPIGSSLWCLEEKCWLRMKCNNKMLWNILWAWIFECLDTMSRYKRWGRSVRQTCEPSIWAWNWVSSWETDVSTHQKNKRTILSYFPSPVYVWTSDIPQFSVLGGWQVNLVVNARGGVESSRAPNGRQPTRTESTHHRRSPNHRGSAGPTPLGA